MQKKKVGVYCKKNDKIGMIEYTEITSEMASARDEKRRIFIW